jgi:hypothetical protein
MKEREFYLDKIEIEILSFDAEEQLWINIRIL